MELFAALEKEDINRFKQLLDNGADIETRETYGYSLLLKASYQGKLDFVKLLVERGAYVDSLNDYGWTPLMSAAMNNRYEIMIYLLEHGADIKIKNNDGNTTLVNVLRFYKRKKECCDILLEYKHKDTDINSHKAILATMKGDKKTVESLLNNNGVDVNSKNYDDVSLLHLAAFFNRADIMQILLEKGASVNAKATFGETPLLCTTYRNSLDCFHLLLANKADISLVNNVKFSPLMCAACHNYVEMTKTLLSKGASVDSKASDGYTALLYTAHWGAIDCADILLNSGANIYATTNTGDQVLDLAASNNRTKAFLYFHSKKAAFNYKKVEPVLHKIPRFLFVNGSETILSDCKSPINVLNMLYKNDKKGEHSSIISRIILSFFQPFDNGVLAYLLIFLNSLEIASKHNLLEQIDLNEKILQIEGLLTELFKTDALDQGDSMLDLLLPSIDKAAFNNYEHEISKLSWLDPYILVKTRKYEELMGDFRALHRAHTIDSMCGILHYCLKNEIKSVFRHPQISTVVHEVYKTTLAPPQRRTVEMGRNYELIYFKNKNNNALLNFMNSYLNDLICGCEATNTTLCDKLHSFQNLRYCPKNMIVLEACSKLLTLILVTLYGIDKNIDTSSKALPYFIVLHVLCLGFYEIGTLSERNWNFKEYISSGWNILDWASSVAVFVSVVILISPIANPSSLTINGTFVPQQLFVTSAIPLSLTLLQPLSLIKPVGELVIMIREMVYDIGPFFVVYIVCTFGFAVVVSVLMQSSLIDSFFFLYSATLGNFNIEDIDPYLELLTAVYMLSSAILLINLLIARMSTTHQRINDKALQEWSYVYASTVQSFVLIREKSPLSMLPAPLNLITICLAPLHNSFLKKEISIAGTVTDAILLAIGEILSLFYISYIIFQRSHILIANTWGKRKYLMYFTLPIVIPIFLVVLTVLHYILSIIDGSLLKVQSDGMIVGFEPHLRCDREDKLNVNFQVSHNNHDSSIDNPITKNAGKVEMEIMKAKSIKRIDSAVETNDEITQKYITIFTEDDIKRIIRTLNIDSDSNIIERLYEMGYKNEIKIDKLEESLYDIKQILLQIKEKKSK